MDKKLRDELDELRQTLCEMTNERNEKLDEGLSQRLKEANELKAKFDRLKEELISKEEEVDKYFRFLPAMQSEVSMLRKCLKDKKIHIPASKLKKKYTYAFFLKKSIF
jgi:uncharacterized coiled-coil DUF342 family protein